MGRVVRPTCSLYRPPTTPLRAQPGRRGHYSLPQYARLGSRAGQVSPEYRPTTPLSHVRTRQMLPTAARRHNASTETRIIGRRLSTRTLRPVRPLLRRRVRLLLEPPRRAGRERQSETPREYGGPGIARRLFIHVGAVAALRLRMHGARLLRRSAAQPTPRRRFVRYAVPDLQAWVAERRHDRTGRENARVC
jgi:hypothetical protein